MRRALGFCLLGAAAVVLPLACGSSDQKLKKPGTHYTNGGDGAAGEASGGSSADPDPGTGAKSGEGTGATSGESSGGSDGATGGAGGSPGQQCPTGYADCDDDPSDCEQDITLITSCGDCKTSCSSTNATVACEDQACVVKSCTDGYADCVNGGDDGCESTLDTDEHCGSCDRNCAALGATCATSKTRCNELPLQSNQPIGSDNGVNRSWAFTPDGLLHMGSNSYNVTRFPLDGGTPAVIWDAGNKRGGWESLLVVGDTVYWSELGTPGNDFTSAVFSKKILDAADVVPTLAWVPEWQPMFLRKQGNAFYWFSGEYQSGDPGAWIYTRAVNATLADAGTKIMTVDQGQHDGMVAFNVTSDALYWVSTHANSGTANELRTTPLAGGTPTVVPAALGSQTTAITSGYGDVTLEVAGPTLYFNRYTQDALDGIYSFKKGDTEPTWLIHAAGVRTFVLDADYIYYTTSAGPGVWKAPIVGGAGAQISDDGISRIVGQDDSFVYTITSGCCNGSIAKVIK